MGHSYFWTANMNATIPLESNLGCTITLNRMKKLTIHGDIWNDSSMLVICMFLFLYVGWTTLGQITPTQRSTSRMFATRYFSRVRYGMIGKAGRSRTPLIMFIKNI